MSTYLNVGVRWAKTGERMPSKKALKDAIELGPDLIEFDGTSPLQSGGEKVWTLADIHQDQNLVLSVVGPDPYTNRRWYAQVRIGAKGKVRVT